MRFLLAFLATLALASSPVTATAAQVTCGRSGPATMTGMDMPGMNHTVAQHAADPCCDPGGHQNHSSKSCTHGCTAACAPALALALSPMSMDGAFARSPTTLPSIVSARLYQPSGPEPPPKSMI